MRADLVRSSSCSAHSRSFYLEWTVKGERGVVVLRLIVCRDFDKGTDKYGEPLFRVIAHDLGGHALSPRHYQKDDEPTFASCDLLDGHPCWYDGSSLQPYEFLQACNYEPDDEAIYRLLEDRYASWLEAKDD